MDLIPKIGSLARLPELLKKKQEAEEHSKRRKREQQKQRKDRFVSQLKNELALTVDPETLSKLKITLNRGPEEEKPPKDKKLGNSVDLSV